MVSTLILERRVYKTKRRASVLSAVSGTISATGGATGLSDP